MDLKTWMIILLSSAVFTIGVFYWGKYRGWRSDLSAVARVNRLTDERDWWREDAMRMRREVERAQQTTKVSQQARRCLELELENLRCQETRL